MLYSNPFPPMPPTETDSVRWDHTRLRRRLLTGYWRDDLIEAITRHVDPTRQAAWGIPDLSSNVLKSIATQLAVNYDREPTVAHTDGVDVSGFLGDDGALAESGWTALMPRFSAHVIGLRENVMHISASPEGDLHFRPVPPDYVIARAHPTRPDVPVEIWELRLRTDLVTVQANTGAVLWTWDRVDCENEEYRVHLVGKDGGLGADVSGPYLEGGPKSGADYPFRLADGTPILPYELYHATKLGDGLWDPFDGIEIVEGTITAAVLWTFFVHVIRDASWPQRYGVDVAPLGAAVQGNDTTGARNSIVTDPASIILFQTIGDAQAVLSQFSPGADPSALEGAISAFERRVAEYYGISPSDLQRTGENARSGYAIALTNAGKRESQRRFTPQFRDADQRLLIKAAALLNRATGSNYPEEGYTVSYQPIPLSDQEMEAKRRDIMERLNAGLLSKSDAYRELHAGLSREQAITELERIKAETNSDAGGLTLSAAAVQVVTSVVTQVAAGEIPRASGVEILCQFYGIAREVAEAIVPPDAEPAPPPFRPFGGGGPPPFQPKPDDDPPEPEEKE